MGQRASQNQRFCLYVYIRIYLLNHNFPRQNKKLVPFYESSANAPQSFVSCVRMACLSNAFLDNEILDLMRFLYNMANSPHSMPPQEIYPSSQKNHLPLKSPSAFLHGFRLSFATGSRVFTRFLSGLLCCFAASEKIARLLGLAYLIVQTVSKNKSLVILARAFPV